MTSTRMGWKTQAVLAVFLKDPQKPRYGLEICEEARLGSGTIYPTLAVLERDGWLESDWAAGPEPRRRYYRLSTAGLWRAQDMGPADEEDPRPAGWRRVWRWLW